jgi:hypothetical protein
MMSLGDYLAFGKIFLSFLRLWFRSLTNNHLNKRLPHTLSLPQATKVQRSDGTYAQRGGRVY